MVGADGVTSALATVLAHGGTGGTGTGIGNSGGAGGAGLGSGAEAIVIDLDPTALVPATATATVEQTGGTGGAGLSGADGGAGGVSTLTEAAIAVAAGGTATMNQHAIGGTGGSGDASGLGGAGGGAISSLDLIGTVPIPDLSDIIDGTAKATGGTGGRADSVGGDGGSAVATTAIGSDVASKVTATAEAFGGDGADGGVGGGAVADAHAVATNGEAIARAHAQGGHALTISDAGGAQSVATAEGSLDGLAQATAGAGAGDGTPGSALVTTVTAEASSTGGGFNKAFAVATYDASPLFDIDPSDANASIEVVVAPGADLIDSYVLTLPTVAAGLADATSYFALVQAVAEHSGGTGTQTMNASIDFSVDLAAVADPQNLVMGFNGVGTGLLSMSFSVTVEGQELENHSWTDLADALAYFNDRFTDYGSIEDLDADGNGSIDFQFAFEIITGTAGDGFAAAIIVADPPPAAGSADAYEMTTAMAEHLEGPLASHDPLAPAGDAPLPFDALYQETQQDHFVV